MSEFSAEFIGTMLLILFGAGVVANVVLKGTKGYGSGWIVITWGWALGVFIGVLVAGPHSGAHLNPAVSIGLAVAGKFPWEKVPVFIAAQMLGAMLGAFLTWIFYYDHFNAEENPGNKLAVFSTGPAIRNLPLNFICEVIGTFVLVYAVLNMHDPVLADAANTPIGLGSLGALPVSFLVLGIGLALGGTTGYAINPARDLGPRIIHALVPIKGKGVCDWGYSWVPVAGPIIGAIVAAILHKALHF